MSGLAGWLKEAFSLDGEARSPKSDDSKEPRSPTDVDSKEQSSPRFHNRDEEYRYEQMLGVLQNAAPISSNILTSELDYGRIKSTLPINIRFEEWKLLYSLKRDGVSI